MLSVVIRTKDEADRLRLTLQSLARQAPRDVVVVDDGSSDHTSVVLADFDGKLPLKVLRHPIARGRCAASNAGAAVAEGDILFFLDGDTVAGPDCLVRHVDAHAATPGLLGRGETLHLRGTRLLLNPETATPRPGEEDRVARLPLAEIERLKVTRQQIMEDFDSINRRAELGVYPGAGPRQLFEMEAEALRDHPECSVLWAAASGSNFSVNRAAFLAAGGFDPALDINEHRELALRLCLAGGRMGLVEGARTYHLTHRSGWRDPLAETGWEIAFYQRHSIPAVKLLSVLWASLSSVSKVPQEARITSLPALENAARGQTGIDYDAVRRMIPGLPDLSRNV